MTHAQIQTTVYAYNLPACLNSKVWREIDGQSKRGRKKARKTTFSDCFIPHTVAVGKRDRERVYEIERSINIILHIMHNNVRIKRGNEKDRHSMLKRVLLHIYST